MQPDSTQTRTRWSARQLATMALFIALGAVLSFIQLPILPVAAGMGITYDPSNVPAAIGGLAFGVGGGSVIGILTAVVHGLLSGDMVGMVMNGIAVLGFVIPASAIHKKDGPTGRLIIGLVVGCLVSVALMIVANILVWPLYYFSDQPFMEAVTFIFPYLLPVVIPFNLLKAGLNALLSFLLYKSLHGLLEA